MASNLLGSMFGGIAADGQATHIEGLSELNDFMQQLPALVERKLLRGALRAGQKVTLDLAKAGVHNISGDLAASLRVSTSARGGTVHAKLKAGNKKAFYARWVEFGTAAHYIKPKNGKSVVFAGIFREGVQHPGSKKNPFMRPALDQSAQENSASFQAIVGYIQSKLAGEFTKIGTLPDEQDGMSK
jgi:HK97 gp10 family phage protein